MNIFLIGPMGSGKTTVGKLLAEKRHYTFIDADEAIVQQEKMSVTQIFEEKGQAYFRDVEEKIIDELTAQKNIVLSTGGGAVLREKTRKNLSTRGQVIYLKTAVDTQWERLKETNDRPFLKTVNPKLILQQLQNDREVFYQEIKNFIIETDSKTPEAIVEEILCQTAKLN